MVDLKPSRRTVMTVGIAALVGSGGAYFLEGGSSPDTPQCETSPPVDLDAPTIGNPEGRVPITAYTDFSCPHCKDFELNVLPKIQNRYLQSPDVGYIHQDFPLPVDKWSRPAASAAREVQRRTDDATFFGYSKKLYQNQDDFSYRLFSDLANSIGVDGEQVQIAARQNRYCQLLNNSINQGSGHNVTGTPTVIIAGQKFEAPNISDVADAIQKARSSVTSNMTSS